MNKQYIIINKTTLEKRIEELEDLRKSTSSDNNDYYQGQIRSLKEVLHQSIPLIPEIEKAFDAGSKSGSQNWDSWTAPNIESDKQEYISNLKLNTR